MMEINKIHQGDCLELMQSIDDDSIDLVITSPPYNLGSNHHTGNIRHSPYSDDLPEEEYQLWQLKILNEIHRILTSTGSLFYNHKNRIREGKQISPYEWLLKSKLIIKQELVWFNGSPNFDKCRFYPMTERIYWLSKDIKTDFYNNINHHDLFNWNSVGTKNEHKRAYPIELVRDIINCFPENIIVLDPFMGSGTTAIACLKTNRNFIGMELEPKYVDIANKRIAEFKQQLTMAGV